MITKISSVLVGPRYLHSVYMYWRNRFRSGSPCRVHGRWQQNNILHFAPWASSVRMRMDFPHHCRIHSLPRLTEGAFRQMFAR